TFVHVVLFGEIFGLRRSILQRSTERRRHERRDRDRRDRHHLLPRPGSRKLESFTVPAGIAPSWIGARSRFDSPRNIAKDSTRARGRIPSAAHAEGIEAMRSRIASAVSNDSWLSSIAVTASKPSSAESVSPRAAIDSI